MKKLLWSIKVSQPEHVCFQSSYIRIILEKHWITEKMSKTNFQEARKSEIKHQLFFTAGASSSSSLIGFRTFVVLTSVFFSGVFFEPDDDAAGPSSSSSLSLAGGEGAFPRRYLEFNVLNSSSVLIYYPLSISTFYHEYMFPIALAIQIFHIQLYALSFLGRLPGTL